MPRDDAFEFFSVHEGALFRRTVREAFAEHGLEVTLYAQHAADNTGRQFGLGNLAATCHHDDRGRRLWPQLIRRHISVLLRTLDGPSALDTMPAEQLLRRVYPRIVDSDLLDRGHFGYARPLTPGLCEVLALDLPDSVMLLNDESLEPLGGVHALRAQAVRNLRSLPVEGHEAVEQDDGQRFHVVMGDSFFTASRVLVLDELVQQVTGRPLGPDGALVAMPFRHQLVFHPIEDISVIASLGGIARYAAAGHEDAVGPVSPHLFWWRAGELVQLSELDEGTLTVTVGADFQDVLERLAEQAEGGREG
ncbi:hypothetical protein SRB5_57150 [Streptomyces sp. RB5]|uniref:Uncharacterized protein n=1 Tax=Streptomyces smaragdinus TaxID=2585196 RepID=A0A7K0CQC9_9ACTN|nr:hypothetical protein [Streptomyces smaragdinus]